MKKEVKNELSVEFPSLSSNESLARSLTSAFCLIANPTMEELADIKCAVSEAVTNCIVHGYAGTIGTVEMGMRLYADRTLKITVKDHGCGIPDVHKAMEPLFTTDPAGERSGMGFSIMENFTDTLKVNSTPGKGTKITMTKKLSHATKYNG